MSEDETYQLIENYLNGVLGKEEKTAFEKQLSTDVELSKKVRLHQLTNELVIENRLLSVNNILLEEKNKGNSGNNLTKIIFSTAILMVGTLVFFTWKNKSATSQTESISNKLIPAENTFVSSTSEQIKVTESKRILPSFPVTEPNKNQSIVVVSEPQTQINESIQTETIVEEKDKSITELPVPTPVQEKAITGPCAAVQLNAKIFTTASCKEESNGSIMVREFAGGTAPYSVNIKNQQQEYISSLNVPAGNYTVSIKDKKGCSNTFHNIQVLEKICNKEYTFNPFIDELLTLPSQEQHGTLTIYERSGNPYFTKEIEPLEMIHWNGYSKNGELNAGYFIFVLALKDGQTIKGGITIVR